MESSAPPKPVVNTKDLLDARFLDEIAETKAARYRQRDAIMVDQVRKCVRNAKEQMALFGTQTWSKITYPGTNLHDACGHPDFEATVRAHVLPPWTFSIKPWSREKDSDSFYITIELDPQAATTTATSTTSSSNQASNLHVPSIPAAHHGHDSPPSVDRRSDLTQPQSDERLDESPSKALAVSFYGSVSSAACSAADAPAVLPALQTTPPMPDNASLTLDVLRAADTNQVREMSVSFSSTNTALRQQLEVCRDRMQAHWTFEFTETKSFPFLVHADMTRLVISRKLDTLVP